MRPEKLKELRDTGFISDEQFVKLEGIETGKVVSVFYELRIMLYLGVMLFTTGIGILIYQNIGDVGHILSIGALSLLTIISFLYVFRFAHPYSDDRTKPPTPFFDYIVLGGSLLFISVLTYLQVMYNIFDEGMGATTLVTSAFFFYAAYRFDHLGVLSLAITALASFFSISISPQKWYSSDFLDTADLHIKALIFGVAMAGIALLLERKKIKEHFTFSYVNFSALIFLSGALSGVFIDDGMMLLYLAALYGGCALTTWYAHIRRSFLFLLYAFVFGFIGTTYCLADLVLDDIGYWFMYLLASCGGFVFLILRYKSYFKRTA
jgi:hypothetical protein